MKRDPINPSKSPFIKGRLLISPLWKGEGVKKLIWFFFMSFRRKPESSVFMALRTDWTPVFTGVTAEIQFFHSFGGYGGI